MLTRATLAFILAALLAGCGGKASNDGAAGAGGGTAGRGGADAGVGGGASGTGGGAAGQGGSAAGTGGSNAAGTGGNTVDAGDGGPGGIDGAPICSPLERPVAGFKPDILVLLDISGSMNNDVNDQSCPPSGCGANSKWAQTYPAVEQVVAATDLTVNWGLKFFSESTSSVCSVSNGAQVPLAGMNAAAVTTAIMGRTDASGGLLNGGGRTPTRAAVGSAAAYLSIVTDGNPRFILLATDGLPTCNAGTTDTSASDATATVLAIADASNAGIATFVIGIGTQGQADQTLSQMAIAGGYPRSSPDYRAYYPVTNPSELIAALNQLVGIARSCRLPLGAPPPGFSSDAIDVLDNGTAVPRDANHVNGWDYADATHTSFNLYGPVCNAIMNGAVARISVVYRCLPAG